MRVLKIIGIALAAVIGLIVIAAVALLLWVDPNDYRDDIASLVRERTGRPLEIAGPIDLKIFPRLALRIDDVKLGNPPGYGSGPFLTVKSASLGVRLFPLLHRRVEISRIAVEGLEAHLVSRSDDDNNWKDLTEAEPSQAPGESSTTTSIAGVDVSRSLLVYRDESEDSTIRLSALELHMGALEGTDPVPLETAFEVDSGSAPALGSVRLTATARFLDSVIELGDVKGTLKWNGAADSAGPAASVERETPAAWPIELQTSKLRLDLDHETLDPTTVELQLGKMTIQAALRGEKLFEDRLVTGRLTVPATSPRETMKALDIDIPETADPKVLSRLELSSDFRLTEDALRLADLTAQLDQTRLTGTLAIESFETGRLGFDLRADAIDLDRYSAPKEPDKPKSEPASGTGRAAGEPSEPLPLDALRALELKGVVSIERLHVAGIDMTQVRLPLDAHGGIVRAAPTEARLLGGRFQGSTTLDATTDQARLSLDEHVQGVALGPLLEALLDSSRVVGRANVDARLVATGATTDALLRSLSGRIDTRVDDGAIDGVDLWYELRRARALFARQAIPARSGAARTEFKTLSGSATLGNGVARNDDLGIDMDYLKASGRGTLDIASHALDYRLVAEIYKLPDEGEAKEMADLKAAEIPISVTGSLDDMKIRPDLQALVKSRVKEKAEELKEKIGEKLGDKLKDLLRH